MGWVYALVTPSMSGIVKFGATERDPEERLREANAHDTWRPPEPYVIAASAEVGDPFAVERGIHAILATRRINPRREFFRFTTEDARALIALIPRVTRETHDPRELEDVDMSAAIIDETASLTIDEHLIRETQEPLPVEQTLRAWVDRGYVRIDRSQKDAGMRMRDIYDAYVAAVPRVHARLIPKFRFGAMIREMFPGVGPHDGMYLLQTQQAAQNTQALVAQTNNDIREWLEAHYTITGRAFDMIGATALKQAYMTHARIDRLSDYTFRCLMLSHRIPHKKVNTGMVYTGIRRSHAPSRE
jgi:hypothetical protein